MSILTGLVRRASEAVKGAVMDVEDFGDEFTPNPEIAKVKIK